MATVPVFRRWGSVTGQVAEWIAKCAEALDLLADGFTRTGGTVTLTANAASTTVTNRKVSNAAHITLTPTTANAAAELATMYVSARTQGASFTITHANNAQTDRTFTYEIRVV